MRGRRDPGAVLLLLGLRPWLGLGLCLWRVLGLCLWRVLLVGSCNIAA